MRPCILELLTDGSENIPSECSFGWQEATHAETGRLPPPQVHTVVLT